MATQYEKIVSQSGMTHYINPAPKFSGSFHIRDRVQTLCKFHVKPEHSISANGSVCDRCAAIARTAATG